MKAEKIIKPANGYLMLLIIVLLFFGGIALIIKYENPVYLLATLAGFIGFFGL